MKLNLISVGRLPWYFQGMPLFSFYTPRLGLPYIAAVTPADWEVKILDGIKVEDIDFNEQPDLVGFSILTPFANESYRAASLYREKGIKVVMGGVHPTLLPQEAKKYADSVVVGEGEEVWPELLRDFRRNELKEFYIPKGPVKFDSLPTPKYSLLRKEDYFVTNAIQLVRGCPYGNECKFCIVPKLFGNKYRVMPVEKAIKQISLLEETQVDSGINVAACCALNHSDYTRAFAEAIKPMNIKWCGGGQLHRLDNERLLKLLKASGCEYIYIESEVVSKRKDSGKFEKYCEVIKKIHENGINISYNFTVGFDNDNRDVFEEIVYFAEKNNLRKELCVLQFFTPWPNTDTFNQLEQAGRIIDKNWTNYDNTKVVFKPKLMSIQDLNRLSSTLEKNESKFQQEFTRSPSLRKKY